MRYFILIFGILFLSITCSNAQFSKGDILINLSGSYIESNNSFGVTSSMYSLQSKQTELNFSIGYNLNHFIVGIGLEYNHEKGTYGYYFRGPSSLFLEANDFKINGIAPLFYVSYYKQIIDKLYFTTSLRFSYSFLKSDQLIMISSPSSYPSTSHHLPLPSNILSVYLQPELNYLLTNHIGITLKMGGVKYKSFDSESHEWNISLNPSNWEYGLFLRL